MLHEMFLEQWAPFLCHRVNAEFHRLAREAENKWLRMVQWTKTMINELRLRTMESERAHLAMGRWCSFTPSLQR